MHAHCHDTRVKWGREGTGEYPYTHPSDCTFCTPQSFSDLVTSNTTDLCSVNSYNSGAPRAKRARAEPHTQENLVIYPSEKFW